MSRFRSYGQGNGRTRMRTLRENRRMSDHQRVTAETEMGNRPGIARILGIADADFEGPPEPIEHDVSACREFGCRTCQENQRTVGGLR